MKTVLSDIDLQDAVATELSWDPRGDDSQLYAVAKDGAIEPTGSVTSDPQKWAAVQAAERIYRVRAVAGDIQVVLPRSVERGDATPA